MTLFSHQSKAKEHLQKWKVGALFMEAGTGKTRVACELVNSVDGIDLVVWFAPLRTIKTSEGMDSIVDEVNKWGGFHCECLFLGIESVGCSDRIYMDILNKVRNSRKPFLVVDESLKIKNLIAKRTKRLLTISQYAEHKLILNGTPMSRDLLDVWAQMEFLSPKILQMDITRFKNTFCKYTQITKRFGHYRQYVREFITGYENIDFLYSLIRHYIYECDLELQVKQIYNTIDYTLDDDVMAEYMEIKERFLNDETLMWKSNNIFLEMTQKMQHSYCCTESKFIEVKKLFQEIDESKTIIFCKYIKSREQCMKEFPKATVLSYQQSSFGLNLQHFQNTIYFDKSWDYAVRTQSHNRTYRIGQRFDCRYWDLNGNVGLDNLINQCIERKIGIVEYFKSISREKIACLL